MTRRVRDALKALEGPAVLLETTPRREDIPGDDAFLKLCEIFGTKARDLLGQEGFDKVSEAASAAAQELTDW